MLKLKDIKDLKDEEVKPLDEGITKVRNRYKVAMEPYEDSILLLKTAIKDYHKKKELDAYKKNEKTGVMVELPKTTIRTVQGTVSIKKTWTFSIEDESLIPKKYWSTDKVKINKAIREGARDIGGLRIFQASDVAFRK